MMIMHACRFVNGCRNRSLALIVASALLGVGCSFGPQASFDGNVPQAESCGRIALVEAVLSPPDLPLFPLIDAAMFNSAFDAGLDDFRRVHEELAEGLPDRIGSVIAERHPDEVLYGKKLQNSEAYQALANRIEVYPPKLDNDRFPAVFLGANELQLFDLSDESSAIDLVSYSSNGTHVNGPALPQAKPIAEALDSDCIVIASGGIRYNTGAFGIKGTSFLIVRLYYYSADGTLVAVGSAITKGITAAPEAVEPVRVHFANLESVLRLLMVEMYGKAGA